MVMTVVLLALAVGILSGYASYILGYWHGKRVTEAAWDAATASPQRRQAEERTR